jgi:hypothetical protein
LKLGGGDHRKFDRVGYMIGLVAGYVTFITCINARVRACSTSKERREDEEV